VARLGAEISRLKKDVDALVPLTVPAWNHWSEERERESLRLLEQWLSGDDLSDEDPTEVASLDEYGPIAFAACDKNFNGDRTVEEHAEHYLSQEAAEAWRRRVDARQEK
jgi:DNA polymerase III delta prime subunit